MKKTHILLIAGLSIIASLFLVQVSARAASSELGDIRALFETSLASRITSSDVAFTLINATDIDGTSLASSTYGFIIDEGTANEEFVIADCTATACLRAIRGVSGRTGTSSVTTLKKEHRRGASVKITDAPILLYINNMLRGLQRLGTPIKYNSIATTTVAADTNNLVTVGLLNDTAFAGAGVVDANTTVKGNVEIAIQSEAASSTALGGSGATLAIPASMATDTPNTATKASRVLMSDLGGLLKSAWLDLSTYTGKASTTQLTASGEVWLTSSTTLATTTIDVTKIVDSNLNQPLWSLIAATTTAQDQATTTISFPARKLLKIHVDGRIDSNASTYIYFNGDNGINYSYAHPTATGTDYVDYSKVGQIKIPITKYGGTFSSVMDIQNPLKTVHTVIGNSIGETNSVPGTLSSTTLPFMTSFVGVWSTSTAQQITSLSITGQGGVGNGTKSGTIIYVYGSSF